MELGYYESGYANNPQIAFNASNQNDQDIFWHMYGMGIWATYLDEFVGGEPAVLATWENSADERGTYSYGMRDAMRDADLDFDTLYNDFIVQNTVMAYADQRSLTTPDELGTVSSLPKSDEVSGNKRPEGYGQTYTRIEAGAGEGNLVLDFSGDADVEWAVHLVEVSRNAVLRDVAVEVVDGVGTATLEGFGDEDVMLVVSPLEVGDDKHDYSYSLSVEEGGDTDTTPTDDTGGGTDDTGALADDISAPDGADEVELSGGCGCHTGGTSGMGLGLALGALALARRR